MLPTPINISGNDTGHRIAQDGFMDEADGVPQAGQQLADERFGSFSQSLPSAKPTSLYNIYEGRSHQ